MAPALACTSPPGGDGRDVFRGHDLLHRPRSERMVACPRGAPAPSSCSSRGASWAAGAACVRSRGPSAPPSVLLVTIDTLRADRVGAYGDAEARTPAPRRASRARECSSSAPRRPFPSPCPLTRRMLTGLLPPQHGVRGQRVVRPRPRAANPGGGPRRSAGLRRRPSWGRSRWLAASASTAASTCYDDAFERAPGLHFDFAGAPGRPRGRRGLELAGQDGGPRVPVGAPLRSPRALRSARGLSGRRPLPRRGRLRRRDDRAGCSQPGRRGPVPSFVAVTSDHGEAFGEHGEESHGLFVYDTTLRVPLVLRGPGLPRGVGVSVRASPSLDLAATLVDLGGAEALPGRSLRRFAQDPGDDTQAAPVLRRDPRAAARLRLERPAELAGGPLQVRPGSAARALRPRRPIRRRRRNLVAVEPGWRRGWSRPSTAGLQRMGEAREPREARRRVGRAAARARLRAGAGRAGSGADPKDRLEVARLIAAAAGPFPGPASSSSPTARSRERDPENPLVNFRLADALLRAGRTRESIALFRKVVAARAPLARSLRGPRHGASPARPPRGSEERRSSRPSRWIAASGQAHYNLGELARAARRRGRGPRALRGRPRGSRHPAAGGGASRVARGAEAKGVEPRPHGRARPRPSSPRLPARSRGGPASRRAVSVFADRASSS